MHWENLRWEDLSPGLQARNMHLKAILGGGAAEPEKSKYGSQKAVVDGIQFDSRKEARKYSELLLQQKAGEIVKIELQPRFLLQEGYRDYQTLKWVRPIEYVADFRVTYADGRQEVIDTKGFKTKEYRIKLKMFRRTYPEINFIEE